MNDPVPAKPVCRQCGATLDADDNYCRRCGATTPFGVKSGISPSAKRSSQWESPWVILPMLFLMLGPLALPMLWRSRRFAFLWKVVFTVIVAGLTVLLVWLIWFIAQRVIAPLRLLQ